ncbi:MAG: hypothetical protein ACOCWB_03275 [Bacteroidota bacterium]
MRKKTFLDSNETQDFIDWLLPFIKGDSNLEQLKYSYKNFHDALNAYEWGEDEKFEDTFLKFKGFKESLLKSQKDAKKTCLDILEWGGVLPSNQQKIENRPDMLSFLNTMSKFLQSDSFFLDDLNPNMINSGFTKIYAVLLYGWIMYDGRVGLALCYLIREYLTIKGKKEIPSELDFCYGIGRSKKKNRNPNINSNLKFKEMTHNRTLHFVSNIKANWLLEDIANRIDFASKKTIPEKMFSLQTVLFVLGDEIPK